MLYEHKREVELEKEKTVKQPEAINRAHAEELGTDPRSADYPLTYAPQTTPWTTSQTTLRTTLTRGVYYLEFRNGQV